MRVNGLLIGHQMMEGLSYPPNFSKKIDNLIFLKYEMVKDSFLFHVCIRSQFIRLFVTSGQID